MISLPQFTLLHLEPPELVRVAAATGFDAVGFRLLPWIEGETAYSLLGDSKLLAETSRALHETGLSVLDVEIIRISPGLRADDFRAFFEAAARLGARYVLALGMDPDEARLADSYAALCAEAAPFGLRVVLEFIPREPIAIQTLDAAHRVVAAAGNVDGGILVDTVHFCRSGSSLSQLAALPPQLFPYFQIGDIISHPPLRPEDRRPKVLPGVGDLPLADIMRALPRGIPVSVEVPAGALADRAAADAYAREALRTTQAALAE